MSVQSITGDLLDFTHWNVIAHSANCQNTMGAGIAKRIRERYPAAYAADTEAYNAGKAELGFMSVADVGDGRKVANLYTQYRYGREKRHVDYDALYCALEALRHGLENAATQGRSYSLGLPHNLSCMNAGGDWRIVSAMIHALFDESPITVYIVQLPA